MIVALPCCESDIRRLRDSLDWMLVLGGCPKHEGLLVLEEGMPYPAALDLLARAKTVFKSALMAIPEDSARGWPQGPNSMFLKAAQKAHAAQKPFLFMEPDCIPLRTRWADVLEEQYGLCKRPFMGALVECSQPGLPPVSLAGNAVYPADAFILLSERIKQKPNVAFDVSTADLVIAHTKGVPFIQHFWGQPKLPPTFAEHKWPDSPVNTFTLENLNKEAVLFHRNKDGTLLRLLRRAFFPAVRPDCFTVVLPMCNKDGALAVMLAEWMLRMGVKLDCPCVVSSDSDTLPKFSGRVIEVLRHCFQSVEHFRYRAGSSRSWPDGANQAFRNTALRMESHGKPWLWMEADAIPVHRGWLERLQAAYELSGMPFFGPIVPGMGHMNGVGIYPSNVPQLIPNSLYTPPQIAWDSAMKAEMIHLCKNAEPIIQHVWGVVNGQPHPITGEAPVFSDVQKVKEWVHPQAALFHRCKDGSLIQRLAELKQIK